MRKTNAVSILSSLHISLGQDFHTLTREQVSGPWRNRRETERRIDSARKDCGGVD